jgi:hypothetical protein
MIKVNLIGKVFEVKRELLLKIPYFNYLLTDTNVTNYIEVDRLSSGFKHILSYVIDQNHIVPPKYYYEFDFYDVNMDQLPYIVDVSGHLFKLTKDIMNYMNYFKQNELSKNIIQFFGHLDYLKKFWLLLSMMIILLVLS